MTALAFFDKRMVTVLSTYVLSERQKVIVSIPKPIAILDYTKHMGAVDRADHYCGSYALQRKSIKWWRKMFFWLIEVSIVNSFILYNLDRQEHGNKQARQLQYRKNLVKQLVGDVRNTHSKKRGRPSSCNHEERLNNKPHFIMQKENKSTKNCAVCHYRKSKGGRRETSFYCETCTRHPGLHPGLFYETIRKRLHEHNLKWRSTIQKLCFPRNM